MHESFKNAVGLFHAHFTSNPNRNLELGISERLNELPDPSIAASDAHVQRARELLHALESVDRSALHFEEALDLDVATLSTRRDILHRTLSFNGSTTLPQKPTAGDDIGDGLFLLFINDPRSPHERLDDMTERLLAVPAYLETLEARLDVPVTRWAQIETQKVEALPSLLSTLESWAEECNYPRAAVFTEARKQAEEALADYVRRLNARPTNDHFHIGREAAQAIVTTNGIDLTLDELKQIATDFLARTSQEVEALRQAIVAKYDRPSDTSAEALHEWLNQRFAITGDAPAVERVLAAYESERTRIDDFITAHELFPIPEEEQMKVMQTPSFMVPSIPAGAMMGPAPFRSGVAQSLVYLTLDETRAAEHTQLTIPTMMIHEGIPGHHLQLATAARHPSVVRRHVWNAAHGEGWTTMLEDYMLDINFMSDLTDEARFTGKRELSRLGARVAIDLFFMSGDREFLEVGVDFDRTSDDPFALAGSLLQVVTGFSEQRVQAELNWYSTERGYPLSYLTGNHLVWNLKRDLKDAQQDRLSALDIDRAFHRLYLQSGNLPLSLLRRVFENEGLLPAPS